MSEDPMRVNLWRLDRDVLMGLETGVRVATADTEAWAEALVECWNARAQAPIADETGARSWAAAVRRATDEQEEQTPKWWRHAALQLADKLPAILNQLHEARTERKDFRDREVLLAAVRREQARAEKAEAELKHPHEIVKVPVSKELASARLYPQGSARQAEADAIARTGGDIGHPSWRSEDLVDLSTISGKITRAVYGESGVPIPARRPGRGGRPPEFYEEVARRYREVRAEGESNPTQRIADERRYSRNTVAKWVRRARELGYLPPAARGRPG